MASDNRVKITLGYKDENGQKVDLKHTYLITKVPDRALAPAAIDDAVQNFNSHLESASLDTFFTPNHNVMCAGVIEVVTESIHETPINL